MLETQKKTRIFLSPPHMSGNEMKYIHEAFESNWIAPLGPNVESFEREIAGYAGVNGAVAVSSGTAAIHLALCLLNVQKGDIVFCSSLTFVATANPILYLGAEPVFIDSEPDTWNMSPTALQAAFYDAAARGKLPKAVIIVNLYGQSAKMDELAAICHQYYVPIIEDAAESLGARYKGRGSGTFGKFGIYSFNGNKIITTSGGGMLISNDTESLEKARFLAAQARDPARHYQHSKIGFNYRMSNILAGLGRGQLEILDERIRARRRVFEIYRQELDHLPLSFMPELSDSFSNRWLTSFTINQEDTNLSTSDLLSALENENIEARPVWKPLHLQPLFSGYPYYSHTEEKSISDALFRNGVCLPSGSNMSAEDQIRVIQCVKTFFENNGG